MSERQDDVAVLQSSVQHNILGSSRSHLVSALHLAAKHAPVRSMDAQVLANELREPIGGLFVVHLAVDLAPVVGR